MSDIRVFLSEDAESYSLKAGALFTQGYNCSQAVLLAFSDELGLSQSTAAALSSSFGGGMGRLREVCGAVSGMFMVIGLCFGYTTPDCQSAKAEHYKRIQELASQFKCENGSIVCRELLFLNQSGASDPTPELRTKEYYKKRPCRELVEFAALITAQYIINNTEK
ncbi:MAG: C_GCAxxG_C_C family protein [Oscillospiraceae bacterium]|nr:C_GCAxxG_C_C family protein [Oscillospiraceae bacterium]